MVTITLGKGSRHHKIDGETLVDVAEKAESIFNRRNVTLVVGGLALGIILKQQADIRTLRKTVEVLQRVIG